MGLQFAKADKIDGIENIHFYLILSRGHSRENVVGRDDFGL